MLAPRTAGLEHGEPGIELSARHMTGNIITVISQEQPEFMVLSLGF